MNNNYNNSHKYDDYDDDLDETIHIKKKFPLWKKLLLSIIIIALIIPATGYIVINRQLNKINRAPDDISTVAPEDEYFETDPPLSSESPTQIEEIKPEDVVWDDKENDILQDDNIKNILLIGQDRRPGETRARSDSMIILSIDKNTNTLKCTSLLRDMYVQIPGYSDNRINVAYVWGGMKLLDETIEKNFSIHIDKNIEVDFNAFTKIIDTIGGITINITKAEAQNLRSQGFNVSSGPVYMNGNLALAYSRIRHIDSDFYRTNRQRTVIITIFNKIKEQSLSSWYSISNEIFPLLTTDMTNNEIMNTLLEVYNMKADTIESYRIPVDNGYKSTYIRKMAVLLPDYSLNRSYLAKNIYNIE